MSAASERQARDVALIARLRDGDVDAGGALIEAYSALIHKIALQYRDYVQLIDPASNSDDLWQVGALGLLRATKTYDAKKGATFLGYAKLWIIQAIQRYAARCGLIPQIHTGTPRKTPEARQRLKRQQRDTQLAELDRPLRGDSDTTLGDVFVSRIARSVESEVLTPLYLQTLIAWSSLSDAQNETINHYLTGECDTLGDAALRAGLSVNSAKIIVQKMRDAIEQMEAYDGAPK